MNLAVETSTDTGYARPRDPAEIWVARHWQDVLGFCVGIRENFFGVGGNSLDAARVVNAVLDEFDRQLPLNAVTENPTVERFAALVREENGRTLSGPLVELQGGDGTHPPLFMVHPASGQLGSYCHLARALGDDHTVFGLQPVGLHTDAAPVTTVEAMARAYLDEIRAVDPVGPYLLGGCSTGVAVAVELAHLLTEAGAEVRLLAAIDAELVEPTGGLVDSSLGQLAQGRTAAEVLDDWKEHDLVPRDENPDFVTRSLRVWQANRAAVRDWTGTSYPGPLDTFLAPGTERPADWPAAEDERAHECAAGPDGTRLPAVADELRRLIG
ncbi:thioesterase domain-containing protein [Actinophytocola oryzae]|uniref:Phosphopantetheine binding protein n=1 Tax=Actinophytocola oryzae TaxID=502181 RepID=A0A4R7VKI7_9PSEU|nr:thioesterase domain-containing protein [Actinophytocola oryzae]TDV49708.1 phosphopantetheine binding protein [Actinophytocola oryzae]